MDTTEITKENWPAIKKKLHTKHNGGDMYNVTINGHWGDLMTKEVWLGCVKNGMFVDYDGFGDMIDEDMNFLGSIHPSQAEKFQGAYILWYNK